MSRQREGAMRVLLETEAAMDLKRRLVSRQPHQQNWERRRRRSMEPPKEQRIQGSRRKR